MPVDLIQLEVSDFDIIFGLDWLASYHAIVDYLHWSVNFLQLVSRLFRLAGLEF